MPLLGRQPCGGCGQDGNTQSLASQPQAPRYDIPLPGLNRPVGSGSVLGQLLYGVGIQPCGGCQQRKQAMNRTVGFRPIGWV